MPVPSASDIRSAWTLLWDPKSPFHLPSAVRKKTRIGLTWFRPLSPIAFPATGPIVVLNSTAFGIVTMNLLEATITDLASISPDSLRAVQFEQETGRISVEIGFAALKLAGEYEVRRGRATGDAVKIASQSFRNHPLFAATPLDPDPNITLAKSYQPQLAQTANGRSMLDSYYTHNDAYSSAFGNSVFLKNWQKWQTGGKTTSEWSALTANAAQPANVGSVVVNSSDGKTFDNDYNLHAFRMQNLLVTACNQQGNNDAALAASNFQTATTSPSGNPQTVSSVFDLIATSTPPDPSNPPETPEWIKEIDRENAPIHEAIAREEEDVRRGIIIREETIRPIRSGFRSYIEAPKLTLVGSVTEGANGAAQIRFDSMQGSVNGVELALGVFPGKLHPELAAAVGKAEFLKALLARQVNAALAASPLMNYIGRLMTLALAREASPLR